MKTSNKTAISIEKTENCEIIIFFFLFNLPINLESKQKQNMSDKKEGAHLCIIHFIEFSASLIWILPFFTRELCVSVLCFRNKFEIPIFTKSFALQYEEK